MTQQVTEMFGAHNVHSPSCYMLVNPFSLDISSIVHDMAMEYIFGARSNAETDGWIQLLLWPPAEPLPPQSFPITNGTYRGAIAAMNVFSLRWSSSSNLLVITCYQRF